MRFSPFNSYLCITMQMVTGFSPKSTHTHTHRLNAGLLRHLTTPRLKSLNLKLCSRHKIFLGLENCTNCRFHIIIIIASMSFGSSQSAYMRKIVWIPSFNRFINVCYSYNNEVVYICPMCIISTFLTIVTVLIWFLNLLKLNIFGRDIIYRWEAKVFRFFFFENNPLDIAFLRHSPSVI